MVYGSLKDRSAITRRSLKDRSVTVVSLTCVLISCVFGVWLGCIRYFQLAHLIPMVGVGKRGEHELVLGNLPRQHSFGTTLRFIGHVPADSRQ